MRESYTAAGSFKEGDAERILDASYSAAKDGLPDVQLCDGASKPAYFGDPNEQFKVT